MRKTMITMATVALSAGLFAGTALAGGDEGKGDVDIDICQPQHTHSPAIDALETLTGHVNKTNFQCLGKQ
jgi:hypothetical protein